MFIAGPNPDLRRRSEERELTSPITTRSLPLLRTTLGMLFVVGYKHVTPNGVKPADLMSVHSVDGPFPDQMETLNSHPAPRLTRNSSRF
jgi:hypothetical protein